MIEEQKRVIRYDSDGKEIEREESILIMNDDRTVLEDLHKYYKSTHPTTIKQIREAYKEYKSSESFQ